MENIQVGPVDKLRDFVRFTGATPHGSDHDALLIQAVQVHSTNDRLVQQFEGRGQQSFPSPPSAMSHGAPYPPFGGGQTAPPADNPYPSSSGTMLSPAGASGSLCPPLAGAPSYPPASAPSYPPATSSYPPAGGNSASFGQASQPAYPDVNFAGGPPAPAQPSPYPPYGASGGGGAAPAAPYPPYGASGAIGAATAAPYPPHNPGGPHAPHASAPPPYPMTSGPDHRPPHGAAPYPGASAPGHQPPAASPYPMASAPALTASHAPSPYPIPGGPDPKPAHAPSPYPIPGGPDPKTAHAPSPYPIPGGPDPKPAHAPSPYRIPGAPDHKTAHAPYPAAGAPHHPPRQHQAAPAPAPSRHRRKRALLIGVSYCGTVARDDVLQGSCTDVEFIRYLLCSRFGFDYGDIRVLLDAPTPQTPGPILAQDLPTQANMLAEMARLVEDLAPGDSLFFHFSGHGSQLPDESKSERDSMNEMLYPMDWRATGPIADDVINKILIRPLTPGVRLHALVDACHSGTSMDLRHSVEYSSETGRFNWKDEGEPDTRGATKSTSGGFAAMFSACDDSQVAAETASLSGVYHTGVATICFVKACEAIFNRGEEPTYRMVLTEMSKEVRRYEEERSLTDKRRGLVPQVVSAAKALLGAKPERHFQTPQLSVSDTNVPADCTDTVARGFLNHVMRI